MATYNTYIQVRCKIIELLLLSTASSEIKLLWSGSAGQRKKKSGKKIPSLLSPPFYSSFILHVHKTLPVARALALAVALWGVGAEHCGICLDSCDPKKNWEKATLSHSLQLIALAALVLFPRPKIRSCALSAFDEEKKKRASQSASFCLEEKSSCSCSSGSGSEGLESLWHPLLAYDRSQEQRSALRSSDRGLAGYLHSLSLSPEDHRPSEEEGQ